MSIFLLFSFDWRVCWLILSQGSSSELSYFSTGLDIILFVSIFLGLGFYSSSSSYSSSSIFYSNFLGIKFCWVISTYLFDPSFIFFNCSALFFKDLKEFPEGLEVEEPGFSYFFTFYSNLLLICYCYWVYWWGASFSSESKLFYSSLFAFVPFSVHSATSSIPISISIYFFSSFLFPFWAFPLLLALTIFRVLPCFFFS